MDASSSLADAIFIVPNALSPQICRDIIAFYEGQGNWRASTYSDDKGVVTDSTGRVAMAECWLQPEHPHFDAVRDATIESAAKYGQEHADLFLQKAGGFRLNRYYENGFMSRHVDYIHGSHGQQQGFPSVSSLLILNDDFEGGALTFFGHHVIPPEPGQAILFPSSFLFPHEVTRVTQGTRYSIVSWLL